MPVLGVLNQKGGSGKSTLSINLAAHVAGTGSRVLLIDADPQGSAADWSAARGERPTPFNVVRFDRPNLHKQIAGLSEGYDLVIIDGPARDAALQGSALTASDIVAIPVQPSGLDLWSTQAFLTLLEQAKTFAPTGQRAAIITSRSSPRGVLARGIREALEGLGLPVLDGTMERLAYREAVTGASTVQELAMQPGAARVRETRQAAVTEIANLATSLLNLKSI